LTAAPCDIWFYHLERSALGRGAARAAGKDPGARLAGPGARRRSGRLRALDAHLWTWRDDSFLPHGLDDEPMADRQPVLLTDKLDNPNGGQALFLLDGAEPGDLSAFERCILLFDGRNEEALRLARGRWKAFKGAGHPVSYWRQGAERGWEKQA
jgi:DNA polymerase-3 subunit chi